MDQGGIEKIVSLVQSTDVKLRLNAVWALKNLLFQADSDIKIQVMSKLGWSGLLM